MPVKKTKTPPVEAKPRKKKTEVSIYFSLFQEEIQLEAYYHYLKRIKNNIPGNEMTDWLEAEKSLRLRNGNG
jgi:hypothetical protein